MKVFRFLHTGLALILILVVLKMVVGIISKSRRW